jgi:hypothetical protein
MVAHLSILSFRAAALRTLAAEAGALAGGIVARRVRALRSHHAGFGQRRGFVLASLAQAYSGGFLFQVGAQSSKAYASAAAAVVVVAGAPPGRRCGASLKRRWQTCFGRTDSQRLFTPGGSAWAWSFAFHGLFSPESVAACYRCLKTGFARCALFRHSYPG